MAHQIMNLTRPLPGSRMLGPVSLWRTAGEFGRGPVTVRLGRMDRVAVERATPRGPRDMRPVLVWIGAPRGPRSWAEFFAPSAAGQIQETGRPAGAGPDHARQTRIGRSLETLDRDFSLTRAPKGRPVTARCCDCRRMEPCFCDRR